MIAGRYHLLRILGAGGMGRVWLAHDQELSCDVALKEIAMPPELPEPALNARIARARSEARHSARLRGNPHVVTVYDSVIDQGLPWLIMEYVPGARDLEAVVRDDGPSSPSDTAKIGLALLDALTTGHQLGILHRDVKPSNVLLTSTTPQEPHDTGIGRVLLSDYGISLQQDVDEPRLTTASGIIGTPGYLAPERARGEEPTPESDLFSLGATLYYAVEGHAPFDRGSYAATLTALLTEEPTPPRRAGRLATVLLSLLTKDPAQRLNADTATHLLTELTAEGLRTRQATVTQPTRQSSPSRSPTQREIPDRAEIGPPSRRGAAKESWFTWRKPSGLPRKPEPKRHTPGKRKTRKGRIIVTAAAALAAGVLTWAVIQGSGSPHKPNPSPSQTLSPSSSAEPYGDDVGLTKELHSGDCVDAVWATQNFKGSPNLGIANCTDAHDGQVLNTDPASSLGDAQRNGSSRCKMLLTDIVNAMADARSYPLPPGKKGWDSGIHNTACLIFNKTVQLAENAGQFRKIGDYADISVSTIGDCWTNQQSGAILVRCSSPHDGQTAGFVKAPDAMTYQTASKNLTTLCQNKYGSTYVHGNYGIEGNITDEDGWKAGFRYVQCDVVNVDGKKLTSSVVTSPPSTQPRSG
ncbi:protein kinase [Streptomyces sp. NPDC002250]|uniref:serine/threonine-protein kinase n=1 Tax=Streptomyces sp. NPDC002250 TaxID=3364641 RepID=UPI0036BAFEBD